MVASANCTWQFGCDQAIPACSAPLDECRGDAGCDAGVQCVLSQCELDELPCVLGCLTAGPLKECVTTACGG